jgi:oxygen-independent coproporphyrinogen-3 oxidase
LQQVNCEFGPQYGEYLEKQAEQQIQAHRLFWDGDILRIPVKARFLSDGIAAELFLVNLV